jgi:hypothetical protein
MEPTDTNTATLGEIAADITISGQQAEADSSKGITAANITQTQTLESADTNTATLGGIAADITISEQQAGKDTMKEASVTSTALDNTAAASSEQQTAAETLENITVTSITQAQTSEPTDASTGAQGLIANPTPEGPDALDNDDPRYKLNFAVEQERADVIEAIMADPALQEKVAKQLKQTHGKYLELQPGWWKTPAIFKAILKKTLRNTITKPNNGLVENDEIARFLVEKMMNRFDAPSVLLEEAGNIWE